MAEVTWNRVMRDYDLTESNLIREVYQDNPRRGNDIRNDIVTVESEPVELEDGKVIRWWGIADGNRGYTKVWHFEDDDRMSDYRTDHPEEIGYCNSRYLIYEEENAEFHDGMEALVGYLQERISETE